MKAGIAALGATSAILLLSVNAEATCLDQVDGLDLTTLSRDYIVCAEQRLLNSSAPECPPPALPACAITALNEAVELALGGIPTHAVTAPGTQRELACQGAIVRATLKYLRERVLALRHGRRRVARSLTIPAVKVSCRDAVVKDVGQLIPRLGGSCAETLGPPGTPVDPDRLGNCLRPALETIAASMVGGPIRPNVVVIMTDDQRWDTMWAMPQTLAALADRGISFKNAFAAQALCEPSRANFFSGRWTHNHGLVGNAGSDIFDHAHALPAWLQNSGYSTAMFGKFMNDSGLLPEPPPGWSEWQVISPPAGEVYYSEVYFNYILNENGTLHQYGSDPLDYSTDLLSRRAMSFIRTHADVPFFAMIGVAAPHADPVPAPRDSGFYANIPPWRPPNWHEMDISLKPSWVAALRFYTNADGTAAVDQRRIKELESLRAVDDAVFKIDQLLERLGIVDNTIFIMLSDHGICEGEHWTSTKFNSYEESIRIPLLFRYPVLMPEPTSREQFVSMVDIAPTIAELAGVSPSIPIDGRSFLPVIEDDLPGRDAVLVENSGEFFTKPNDSVRTANWKYILTYVTSGVTEELYDMVGDPYELHNLAFNPAHAATLDAMKTRFAELKAE